MRQGLLPSTLGLNYVAKDGLELSFILLLHPLKCWDPRCLPLDLDLFAFDCPYGLEMELSGRALASLCRPWAQSSARRKSLLYKWFPSQCPEEYLSRDSCSGNISAQRRGDTVNYNRRMQTWERTSVLIAWGVQRPGIGLRIVSTCYRWHWPVMLSLGED